jgi:hypothetical protein
MVESGLWCEHEILFIPFWHLKFLDPAILLSDAKPMSSLGYKHCLNPKPKMVIPVCKTGIFSYYFRISHMGQDTNAMEWTPHFPHQIIDYVTNDPLVLGWP